MPNTHENPQETSWPKWYELKSAAFWPSGGQICQDMSCVQVGRWQSIGILGYPMVSSIPISGRIWWKRMKKNFNGQQATAKQPCLAESEKHRRMARTGCSWPAITAATGSSHNDMDMPGVYANSDSNSPSCHIPVHTSIRNYSIHLAAQSIPQPLKNPRSCEIMWDHGSEIPTGSSSQSCNINTVESSPVTSSCAVTWRMRQHATTAHLVATSGVSLRSQRRGHWCEPRCCWIMWMRAELRKSPCKHSNSTMIDMIWCTYCVQEKHFVRHGGWMWLVLGQKHGSPASAQPQNPLWPPERWFEPLKSGNTATLLAGQRNPRSKSPNSSGYHHPTGLFNTPQTRTRTPEDV